MVTDLVNDKDKAMIRDQNWAHGAKVTGTHNKKEKFVMKVKSVVIFYDLKSCIY